MVTGGLQVRSPVRDVFLALSGGNGPLAALHRHCHLAHPEGPVLCQSDALRLSAKFRRRHRPAGLRRPTWPQRPASSRLFHMERRQQLNSRRWRDHHLGPAAEQQWPPLGGPAGGSFPAITELGATDHRSAADSTLTSLDGVGVLLWRLRFLQLPLRHGSSEVCRAARALQGRVARSAHCIEQTGPRSGRGDLFRGSRRQ